MFGQSVHRRSVKQRWQRTQRCLVFFCFSVLFDYHYFTTFFCKYFITGIMLGEHSFYPADSGEPTVFPRAAVIVYDITDLSSFDEARHLVSEYERSFRTGLVALAGNKADLRNQRKVKYEVNNNS